MSDFVTASVGLTPGDPACEHEYAESLLLGVKRCPKCGGVVELSARDRRRLTRDVALLRR